MDHVVPRLLIAFAVGVALIAGCNFLGLGVVWTLVIAATGFLAVASYFARQFLREH